MSRLPIHAFFTMSADSLTWRLVDCHVFLSTPYSLCPQAVRDVHRQIVTSSYPRLIHYVHRQFVMWCLVDSRIFLSTPYSLCPQAVWWIVTSPYLGIIHYVHRELVTSGLVDCHVFRSMPSWLCPQTVGDAWFGGLSHVWFAMSTDSWFKKVYSCIVTINSKNMKHKSDNIAYYAYLSVHSQFVLPGFVDCHMSYSLCPQWWIFTPPYPGLIYSLCPQTVCDTRVGGLSPVLFTMSPGLMNYHLSYSLCPQG